jgi:O-antigen/teichoic acid export membrane protein
VNGADETRPPDAATAEPVSGAGGPSTSGLTGIAAANAVAGVAARVAGMVVSIALTPFVLHRIGRELYGVIAASGAVLEYLWLLRGGLGGAMRRFVTVTWHAGDRELADRYYSAGFWWSAVLRTLVVLIGVALARGLCAFMHVAPGLLADATGGLVLLFLSGGVSDTGTILEVPTYVTGRTASVSLVRVLGAALRVALIVPAFLVFRPSLTMFGLATLIGEVAIAVALGVVGARTRVVRAIVPRPDFGSPATRRALFQFGGLALVSQVAGILYLATDNLLIGRIYGPASVTEYSLGTRWAPIITGFLWAGVSALTPLLTQLEARGEVDRSRNVVLRTAAVNSALGVPMCLVPCVVGDVFLARWVGPEYRRAAIYMIAMLVPTLISIPFEPVWMAMVARGRIGWIAVGDIIVAVANPVLSLVLALHFHMGLLGFALGNTAALLTKNLLLRPLFTRAEPGMPPLGRTLLTLPVALAGGAPALILLLVTKPLYSGSLATVIAAGMAGGVLCLAGSVLTAVGWKDSRRLVLALCARLLGGGAPRTPAA